MKSMADISSFAPGQFCWIELATSDSNAARAFYSTLFGWTAAEIPIPGGVYSMMKKDGKTAAALYEEKNSPPHWNNYVSVVSADETAAKAKDLGGKIMMGPLDVMDAGRLAVIVDPTGGIISAWEARRNKGVEVYGETGALCWNEMTTHDAAAAREFYTQLFPWRAGGDANYTEWHLADTTGAAPVVAAIGGMMEMKDAPVGWFPYFAVDDCDASAEQVKANGGRIYKEPADIPNVGRFAIIADPQGAVSAIIHVTQM
jgi:predicted enzyme related to lactoylglutathione lyase